MNILLKSGFVLDLSNGLAGVRDILVEGDIVTGIASSLFPLPQSSVEEDLCIIDAKGLYIFPGLVDIHTHLREPGQEQKETLVTGTTSAAAGGFTTVLTMPNTEPPLDNGVVVQNLMQKIHRDSLVRVYPVGAITKGREGKELAPLEEMKAAGAIAFSDDGAPLMNSRLMLEALVESQRLCMPIVSHCEDSTLSRGGIIQEGHVAEWLGVKGIPCCAEEVMVARDICLAESAEAGIHLAHISTAGSVRLIREAKSRGIKVTAEATPHHFTLTTEAVLEQGSNAKMNPPLRTAFHREAVRKGLQDGTLDAVVSDHAPHSPHEKERPLQEAPFGVIGLETNLPLLFALVHKEEISLARAVELLTSGPAKALGLDCGVLRQGKSADITLVDLEEEFVVDVSKFKSKARNSPFHGLRLKGSAVMTMVGGTIVYEKDGRLTPRRTFLPRKANSRKRKK